MSDDLGIPPWPTSARDASREATREWLKMMMAQPPWHEPAHTSNAWTCRHPDCQVGRARFVAVLAVCAALAITLVCLAAH